MANSETDDLFQPLYINQTVRVFPELNTRVSWKSRVHPCGRSVTNSLAWTTHSKIDPQLAHFDQHTHETHDVL
jgi:hypothetical protein